LLHELYTNAALFVLPSSLEGLPLTLLEAASYGLPLVASDIPPNREIVGIDGPGGRLFPSGDEAALTAALSATLGDLERARSCARVLGDRIISEYDWDEATEATEAVYAAVLGR
jgi:glycosyltransferase involved in cell wall biosynthesis